MCDKKQFYALGMEVNGQLVFLSEVDTSGERPNIKFTDVETEIAISSDLEKIETLQEQLSPRLDLEIIVINFEEEE